MIFSMCQGHAVSAGATSAVLLSHARHALLAGIPGAAPRYAEDGMVACPARNDLL